MCTITTAVMTELREFTRDFTQCVSQHTEGANHIFEHPARIFKNANITYCCISLKKALIIHLAGL